jgi:hypothetical protein
MLILGIESSCDETGVALYSTDNGGALLSHALHSQILMHREYGGVVPELASRDHIRRAVPLLRKVLADGGHALADVDAVAYTQGPGLAGALLVGASFAEGLACSLGVPTVPVHHLEGHLLSPLLSKRPPTFPFIALLVSGGHSQLMRVTYVGEYQLLGETLAGLDVLTIPLPLVQLWFYLRFAALLGHELNLASDISGEKLQSDQHYIYDTTEQGFRVAPDGMDDTDTISRDHIKLLRLVATRPLQVLVQIGGIEPLLGLCLRVVETHAASDMV